MKSLPSALAAHNTSAPLKNRRKKTHVTSTFQRKYVMYIAGFVGLLTLMIFMDYFDNIKAFVIDNPMRPDMRELFDKHALYFVLKFSLFLVSIGLFVTVILHPLAGPIIRIRESAKVVAGGDLTHRMELRKKDELKEVQTEFNDMVSSLQSMVHSELKLSEKISHQIVDVMKMPGLPHSAHKKLEEIRHEMGQLIKKFRI